MCQPVDLHTLNVFSVLISQAASQQVDPFGYLSMLTSFAKMKLSSVQCPQVGKKIMLFGTTDWK